MGKMILLMNIYAPNNYQEQVKFWSELRHIWENIEEPYIILNRRRFQCGYGSKGR